MIKLRLCLLNITRICLELLSQIIFGIWYWSFKPRQLPAIENLILLDPASTLAEKIRSCKVTSEEVTKAFIERIKEVNPLLNAVIDQRFDLALNEAREADEYIRNNPNSMDSLKKEKPFFGVPFTTKDCFEVIGMHQTAGLYARKDIIADKDADSIKLMKNAGAIILGVTNCPELCLWWETSNTIYGITKNAYNRSRIVGGSSGGEGCILSAAGSPMGVGSDIGGSIRMPCFFNGIFGHKPSSGIVSNLGQEPLAVGKLQDFLTTGPMSRFAKDMRPMLSVLASANVNLLSLDKPVDMRKLKIYYMLDDCGNCVTTPVDKELKNAILKTVRYFESAYKTPCKKVQLKEFRLTGDIFFCNFSSEKESHSFCQQLAMREGEVNIWLEWLKWPLGLSRHTIPALLFGVTEKFVGHYMETSEAAKGFQATNSLKQKFREMLGEDGIFLFPPHPTQAPYHYQPIFRPFNYLYTAVFNMLGLPVTACPVGLSSKGLPLGVQVVGGLYQDHLCLSVAEEIERAFGGWVSPSPIN